jgi:hypothetical protein
VTRWEEAGAVTLAVSVLALLPRWLAGLSWALLEDPAGVLGGLTVLAAGAPPALFWAWRAWAVRQERQWGAGHG